MKILLTGVTGYIGKRLLPVLLDAGHEVVCCVRDPDRFPAREYSLKKLSVIAVDFLQPETLKKIPKGIDAAYYLIHSMSTGAGEFSQMEKDCAENFRDSMNGTSVRQVIYLSGIINEEKLSRHLESRMAVENILKQGKYALTTLRAGIIVGSGSASFEIIRDLVEKLPVMIAPKWVGTRSQPIAIRNVIQYLKGVLLFERTFDRSFDIGGPQILTYKQMLLEFARIRKLRRFIISVPVMTPRLSSYWLYFVTSTTYHLAVNLVDSMKVEVVARDNPLHEWLKIDLINYSDAIRLAFDKIEQQEVISSWTDALSGNLLTPGLQRFVKVPSYGCLKDKKTLAVRDELQTLERIWSIGGANGWYYGNWLWRIRGFLDKMVGGVGLRRGRKNQYLLAPGGSLDFWRIILASREEKRLLLYAEMKLPGEAWLEFLIKDHVLYQTATFRPRGIWGRLYWYIMLPAHLFIFRGMIKRIAC